VADRRQQDVAARFVRLGLDREADVVALVCDVLGEEVDALAVALERAEPVQARRRLEDLLEWVAPVADEIGASGGGSFAFDRFASVRFELRGEPGELELYWLEGYGGGLFLPFADAMSGGETYGAGRYLFDTVKGADLGTEDGGLAMDFNFAYNPSCSYDPAWVCPLAPPPNRLAFAVLAESFARSVRLLPRPGG